MKALILALLAATVLICILLDKAQRAVSLKELRRRARGGKGSNTSSIYKLAAQGEALRLFLWLVGSVCGAVLFIKIVDISVWLAVFCMLLTSWLALSSRPLNTNGVLWKVAGVISVPTLKIVSFLHPALVRLSKFIGNLHPAQIHTGLYDKEDLLDLINSQDRQIDNRIASQDLKIVAGTLTFDNKLVREIMTPRRAVKMVAATDAVGPLLMDELHASGVSWFPVVEAPTKEANPKIVGTLYLHDLLQQTDKAKVCDIMKKPAYFINEAQTLHGALEAFLKTKQHLLVVVNNFEEIAGIINLEDVMEQILGQKIDGGFDQYDDLRAIAGIDTKKEHKGQ